MAVDNLNYYSSGLPAGQQTDKYTSQPGCLKSKNLDIFSSSKSVKATAWSEPENTDESGIVLVDQTGNLVLKSDGGVYDRSSGTEVLVKSGMATNFPSYKISYNGKQGTYNLAEWGTPKQLISRYENGVLKYFTLFTDKARYSYSTEKYSTPDSDNVWTLNGWTQIDEDSFKKNGSSRTTTMRFAVNSIKGFTTIPLRMQAMNDIHYDTQGTITITSIKARPGTYFYNAETDQIEFSSLVGSQEIDVALTDNLDCTTNKAIDIDVPLVPNFGEYEITIALRIDPPSGSSDYTWSDGRIYAWFRGYQEFYNYLPVDENRELKEIGEYCWEKGKSFQTLYSWEEVWGNNSSYERVIRYDLVKYMGWESDVSMDIVGMISWNEQVYMIGNMNGNGYIMPCDLSGGRGVAYIAYGCTFRGVTNIDYLMYLVGEDRGISQLWVYNGQELVPLVGGNLESGSVDYIKSDEQYNFDGKMVEYRGNLVLTTSDGRIFEYGQTYGGKGGAFIHDLKPSEHDSLTINSLQAKGNDLIVNYTVVDTVEGTPTTTHWSTVYNDDSPIKNYNTTWEAVYPVVLGNHLLEKEESDLYASYILPDGDTHLEFWGCANHYHFWTFKTSQYLLLEDPAWTHKFGIKGANGDYYLEFVERVESPDGLDWYTFRLVGSLPLMAAGTTNTVVYLDDDGETLVDFIKFSEVNHFRKIGDVYPDTFILEDEEYGKYTEGEFRFHNLNNKLELPKSHSLQVKVIGYGTADHTPELFALDLVANQRDRG